MSYLRAIFTSRDPLLFQKIPRHLVALLKDNATFNVSFQFWIIFCVYPLVTRDQLVFIITHLILLYLVFELNKKVLLKQEKPFAAFTLLFATSVQCTYHISNITCITCTDPHFHWVQSIISIIYPDYIENLSCTIISYVFGIFVKVLLPYC